MGDTERPVPERLGDQDDQAQHLTRTGNGPTVPGEAELLAQVHGAPDMAGYFTGPELVVDRPADEGEPVDQDDAPADVDTSNGGDPA